MNDTPEQPKQEETNFHIGRVAEPEPSFVFTFTNPAGVANAVVPDAMMIEIMLWAAKQIPGMTVAVAPSPMPSEVGETGTPAEGLPKMSGIEKV